MAGKRYQVYPDAVNNPDYKLATRAVHSGRGIDAHSGAIVPPLVASTTFARNEDCELLGEYLYGREHNPNRRQLEACLADLESGFDAACFASGSAAVHALAQCLDPGDRVLIGDDMYYGTRKLLTEHMGRWGLHVESQPLHDNIAIDRGVRAVLCESPTNPMMRVIDLAQLASAAHHVGAMLVVDNTLATPVLQRPIELGADLVLHSTTKFFSGHSDLVGGAVIAREATPTWQRLRELQVLGGAVPSPADCWLLLRSIATLPLRVEAQVSNAEHLAAWLDGERAVERVLYPGLPDHPGYALAQRQMRRPGALLSLLTKGDPEPVMARLQLIVRATSLGGVHTLAEHRAPVEGPGTTTPHNLIRLSIGIEDVSDLQADLARALA